MGTSGTLPDLDQTPTAFDTEQNDLLVAQKYDRDDRGNVRTQYPDSAAVSRFIASWGNRVDDLLRAIQRRFRGEATIGTYGTPADDPQATLSWVSAATQVYLRNAANSAYRALRLLDLQLDDGARILDRAGTPEGNDTAVGGSLAMDTSGRTAYVKTTASGNTGWSELLGANVLDRGVTLVDVNNTVTETDLASTTIPANSLGADGRQVVLEARGDFLNSGASRNSTLRIYVGGSVVWEDVMALDDTTERRPYFWRVDLIRTGSTSAVVYGSLLRGSRDSSGPDVGTGGNMAQGGTMYTMFADSVTIAPTSAITLAISVEHGTAVSTMRTRNYAYQVTLA